MVRKFILFLVTMISCTCSYAQDDVVVTVPMGKWKAMEDSVRHLNDSIISLNRIIVSKDTVIASRNKSHKQMSHELQLINSNCVKLNDIINKMKTDSVDKSRTLGDFRSQLLSVQKQLGRVDTMTIKVIHTYMNLRCSEKRIKMLRNDFSNIANPIIKKDYQDCDTLLSYYVQTYKNVRNIVLEASKKIPSAAMPALRDRYVSEAEQSLSSLPYMKLFFSNKKCSSPYLNTMIKEAKTAICISKRAEDFDKFFKSYPQQ